MDYVDVNNVATNVLCTLHITFTSILHSWEKNLKKRGGSWGSRRREERGERKRRGSLL